MQRWQFFPGVEIKGTGVLGFVPRLLSPLPGSQAIQGSQRDFLSSHNRGSVRFCTVTMDAWFHVPHSVTGVSFSLCHLEENPTGRAQCLGRRKGDI